jgi:hypothetical protein
MTRCIAAIGLGALFVYSAAAQDYPKFETFLGYTYTHLYSTDFLPSLSSNGGSGQFVYNLHRHVGVVLDAGAVTNSNFGGFNIDNTQIFFMAGPRYTILRGRFQPYVQAVFGGVHFTASTPVETILGASPIFPPTGVELEARLQRDTTKFAMAVGGGLDIKLRRWLAFRPGSVDYYRTHIGDFRGIGETSQNQIRYTAGLNFMFGGEKPAPPPPPAKPAPQKQNLSLNLTAKPAEICPGETSQIIATANGVDLNHFHHIWTVNDQGASQENSFAFTGKDPGTFTIGLNVSNPGYNPAAAKTTVLVHEYHPPTGTVTANPAQIYAGDKSALSANFTGQCGGPLSAPTYTASEGSIVGDQFDSTTLAWDSTNNAEQRKTITVTAKVIDAKNGEGTATTTIEVIKKASAAAIRLPDVLFSMNSARVNNCGKRILLEQLRSYYERDSSGSVVLVGHQSADEKSANLSNQRVLNAAAVITAGTGVCLSIPASQVQVSAPGTDQQGVEFDSSFCASSVPAGPYSQDRRVVVWFVPSGAQVPPSVTNSQPASATTVSRLGCPK